MSEINLSKAVRSNLLSLQNTANLMSKTQNRLATGLKVNSALDNPTNFFTASSLNSRAGDINQLLDSMANGIQTLEAADNGLSAITKTLESMQSTLRQARQDKSFQTQSFSLAKIDANGAEPSQITLSGGSVGNPQTIDMTVTGAGKTVTTDTAYEAPLAAAKASYVGGASANNSSGLPAGGSFTISFGADEDVAIEIEADANLDDADKLVTAIQDQIDGSALAGKITVSHNSGVLKLEAVEEVDGTIEVDGGSAVALFGDPDDATEANQPASNTGSDGVHTFSINGKSIALNATDHDTAAKAVDAINTTLGDDRKFEAYEADSGAIGIRAITADAGSLSITGANADMFGAVTDSTTLKFAASVDQLVKTINTDFAGQVRASNDNGKLRIENLSTGDLQVGGVNAATDAIDGSTGDDASSVINGNSVRTDLASQFRELRDQLDKLADDASFNGINLLRGDNLQITFNETGTSELNIRSKDEQGINSGVLDLEPNLQAEALDSDDNIDSLLDDVKTAINAVRSQSSAFGSSLSIVQNRQDFSKNMINTLQTGAANLTLADTNEEAANLLALQTRQQLSSTALSMASQADQAVLRLF